MATGFWCQERGTNLLDGGAPFYDTYETADGRHMAVACLEPQFFAEFARLLPLETELAAAQYDQARWPDMRAAIARRFGAQDRAFWIERFENSDACVAPVLTPGKPLLIRTAAPATPMRKNTGLRAPPPLPASPAHRAKRQRPPARRRHLPGLGSAEKNNRDLQPKAS